MNIEEYREYCLAKIAVTEGFPFDETTLVFKVAGKIFAFTSLKKPFKISLKCDPAKAIELREQFSCITPGYHLNKQHWNTIEIDGTLSDVFIHRLIDHSYDLIVASLPKSKRP